MDMYPCFSKLRRGDSHLNDLSGAPVSSLHPLSKSNPWSYDLVSVLTTVPVIRAGWYSLDIR